MKKLFIPILILLHGSLSFAVALPSYTPRSLFLSKEFFFNQRSASTTDTGFQVTGASIPGQYFWEASFRYQHPEINATFAFFFPKGTPEQKKSSWFATRANYFQNYSSTRALTLVESYTLAIQTPSKRNWTQVCASVGIQEISSWSEYHDLPLFGFSPYFHMSITQAIQNYVFCSGFIGSNSLTIYKSQLTFFCGASLSVRISDNLLLNLRSLVNLSDLPSESRVITMRQITFAFIWYEKDKEAYFLHRWGELL